MSLWRSQDYKAAALKVGGDPAIVDRAARIGRRVQELAPGASPVFTLKHLAQMTGINYHFLRDCVERRGIEPYRVFRIRKRTKGTDGKIRYRIICVPDPRLMKVQRWINMKILSFGKCHEASVAFGKGDNIIKAATPHCGCLWLIKLDIVNFFESVNEQSAFHVFVSMGFQRLVAFELARLCTRKGKKSFARSGSHWVPHSSQYKEISSYRSELMGHLPQGAPTSPQMANLVMRDFDKNMQLIADNHGMIYTRYADDLTISTKRADFSRDAASAFIKNIYDLLRLNNFKPNLAKTSIIPLGSRRVVLGLLVDGPKPNLTKEFRSLLRKHLYFLTHKDHGPSKHADKMGFHSIFGLRNHVHGLIAHAWQVDKELAADCWAKLNRVSWP